MPPSVLHKKLSSICSWNLMVDFASIYSSSTWLATTFCYGNVTSALKWSKSLFSSLCFTWCIVILQLIKKKRFSNRRELMFLLIVLFRRFINSSYHQLFTVAVNYSFMGLHLRRINHNQSLSKVTQLLDNLVKNMRGGGTLCATAHYRAFFFAYSFNWNQNWSVSN